MEKIPAASTMEWSIELDKGLRSKHPEKQLLAIKTIGQRLRQLGSLSNTSRAVTDMYNLVPGEDRLFANTILLRLLDAFKNGDNRLRACVVKSLGLEVKELGRKGRRYDGILAKRRVANWEELLRRVKWVYDKGGERERVLALRMFGCLADFAKDSLSVRYIVLSSLNSSTGSEVKAALFAAGCFCLLTEDFSCVVLEVIINLICSSRVDADVILAAIRVISRMLCTVSISHRAYKNGKKLVLGTLEDVFKVELLSSLSRLAFKSISLVHEQVGLLLLFSRNETPLLKTTALKFLLCMLSRSTFHPLSSDGFPTLLQLVEDKDLPLHYQCDVLRVLQKVIRSKATNVPYMECLLVAESLVHSHARQKQELAVHLLVDILCILTEVRGDQCSTIVERLSSECGEPQEVTNNTLSISGDWDRELVAHRVTALITSRIMSLVDQAICEHKEVPNVKIKLEV